MRAVDWTKVEPVDIVTAGFPCQDISNAGKRAGITGRNSSVWTAVADAVRVAARPCWRCARGDRRTRCPSV
ncbi:DNA cytosine methyltransferase [Actinoplanes aureus]|uniref:DNA cytosine methyltransferase n=1 Tax=Actinoplanes aureus TaxID=2792083 RepID=UPI0028164C22|nr:DNA cytosine methyltransferase [Actinoplanes aureus]